MKVKPPSSEKLADAAGSLELLAAELRGQASAQEEEKAEAQAEHYESPAQLRERADWLDEVAAFLDDIRGGDKV